jgi:hypothetical protein
MSEPTRIPAAFDIPEDLHHEWVFDSPTLMMTIWPEPPNSICLGQCEKAMVSAQDQGAALDWMAYSIEHLRSICSG